MEERKIVTIDLGTRKIGVTVAAQGENGKINILCYNDDFDSDGINHGKVLNPSKLGKALKDALGVSERVLSLKINEVMVGIQKYGIRETGVDASIDIEPEKCIADSDIERLESLVWDKARDMVEAGEEVFGIVPQSFDADNEWNVAAKDIVGMMAEKLKGCYKAYIGRSSYRSNIEAAFREAGVQSVRSVFAPWHTGSCILTPSEMDGGVALMDLGAGSSSVSVFYNGAMRHYGAIPFGGDNITTDIVNLCGIDARLAENIKLGYGGLMPDKLEDLGEKTLKITDTSTGDKIEITAKYLSEIITARMKEILEALLYEIQQSGYADKLKNGIVICGGCAGTLNICKLVKEISGYNARTGAPSRKIFEADRVFFTSTAASSAGLAANFMGVPAADCTEKAEDAPEEVSLTELFNQDNPEDNVSRKEEERKKKEEEKKRKEEEKRLKKERKERGKREREDGGFSLFGSLSEALFGSDEDEENKI